MVKVEQLYLDLFGVGITRQTIKTSDYKTVIHSVTFQGDKARIINLLQEDDMSKNIISIRASKERRGKLEMFYSYKDSEGREHYRIDYLDTKR